MPNYGQVYLGQVKTGAKEWYCFGQFDVGQVCSGQFLVLLPFLLLFLPSSCVWDGCVLGLGVCELGVPQLILFLFGGWVCLGWVCPLAAIMVCFCFLLCFFFSLFLFCFSLFLLLRILLLLLECDVDWDGEPYGERTRQFTKSLDAAEKCSVKKTGPWTIIEKK